MPGFPGNGGAFSATQTERGRKRIGDGILDAGEKIKVSCKEILEIL